MMGSIAAPPDTRRVGHTSSVCSTSTARLPTGKILDRIYEDPRERLHVINVTTCDGRVVRICIGNVWD